MFRTRLNPTKPPAAHRAVLERVGAACRELRPVEEACLAQPRPNHQTTAIFAKHGVLGVGIEREFGGAGAEPLLCVMAAERIGREGFGPCSVFVGHVGQAVAIIARWGSEDQKKRYLTRAAQGTCVLGAALYSPKSNAMMGVTFQEISGGYLLDGQTRSVFDVEPNGAIVTLATRRSSEVGADSAIFIVDTNRPGVRITAVPAANQLPSGYLCDISFEKCQLPPENLIACPNGAEHVGAGLHGSLVSSIARLNSRLLLAASAIGALADCLEIMAERLAPRSSVPDSEPIPQPITHHIAQTAVDLEATRSLVYAAAELKAEFDRHPESQHLALETETLLNEAKYFADGAVERLRSRAGQIRMSEGTLLDILPARHRDVPRPTILTEESAEVMESMIARYYLTS